MPAALPPGGVSLEAVEPAAPDKKVVKPRVHGLDHVSVIVSDLERALDFYRGLLGFRLLGHVDYPDDTPARIVTHLDTGRGLIELVSFARGAEFAGQPAGGASAAIPAFALRVTDLDAIARPLVEAGVSFARLPVSTSSGVRIAMLSDPDGTLIELIEGDTVYSRR
jgi:catechol 2,3-dioxygenase-like lactoylglutathione lyase family enzyme